MAAARGNWGSKVGFVLAAAGSAVGLGNIWKFPYVTGENGGGLFVLIYLVCITLIGLPIMAAEIIIGRAAKKSPVAAFEALEGKKTGWSVVGWMGLTAGFVILSFYIVVAGWAMDYTLKSVVNFSAPLKVEAQAEATIYRAKTPLPKLKDDLVNRRAERRGAQSVEGVRRKAPHSVWQAYERWQQAKRAVPGAPDEAFGDKAFLDKISIASQLTAQIEQERAKAAVEARQHYDKMSDGQIRDAAEIQHRRDLLAKKVGKAFGLLVSDGWTATFWAALFMLLTILVIAGGVAEGIERTCKVMMPALLGTMLVMVIYGMFQPGFGDAVSFVFRPDPHRLKASGVLEALGQAFFTLSLGMGAMITYGSYQASKDNVLKQSAVIAGLDTLVALLACLMIFPITFSFGQAPAAGPGLVFKSMPLAFAEIGAGGMLLAILFFSLLVIAALTSSISLLEVVASYFIDVRGWSRRRAAWLIGGAVGVFALPSAFSFDKDFLLEAWTPGFGQTFFDSMDYLASNWLLPLGGLLIAIYAGWVMPKRLRDAEFEGIGKGMLKGWLLLVRYLAPVLVVLVLLQKVGIIDIDEILFAAFR